MRPSVVLLVLLLVGCASVPEKPVLVGGFTAASLPVDVAKKVDDALVRALTAQHLAGVERDVFVVDEGLIRVYVRILTEGGATGFAQELSLDDEASWPWAFQKRLAALPPPRAAGPAADADTGLDQALRSGDDVEAARWAARLADADPKQSGLPVLVANQARRAREDAEAAALLLLLSTPPDVRADGVLWARVLNRVRGDAVWGDAALRPEVARAFRDRFGTDLETALERPAMVFVEGGAFTMGSDDEPDERPAHRAVVKGFLMAAAEVTQEQYAAVTGARPSLFAQSNDAARRPVERVTWYDAVEFANKLSLAEGLEPAYTLTKRNPATGYPIVSAEVTWNRAKNGYRLPTEAEWEWAARGGTLSKGTPLAGGADPTRVGWTEGEGGPAPVAEKEANELGLYDLSGNVWEWCWDWYGPYVSDSDGEGPSSGILKVGRGGSWHAAPWNARVTARSYDNPGARGANVGFRVVRSVSLP